MTAPDDDPSADARPRTGKILLLVGVGLALLGVLVGVDGVLRPTPVNPDYAKAAGIGG